LIGTGDGVPTLETLQRLGIDFPWLVEVVKPHLASWHPDPAAALLPLPAWTGYRLFFILRSAVMNTIGDHEAKTRLPALLERVTGVELP